MGKDNPFPVKEKREVLVFFNEYPEVAEKIDARFRLNEIISYNIFNNCYSKE